MKNFRSKLMVVMATLLAALLFLNFEQRQTHVQPKAGGAELFRQIMFAKPDLIAKVPEFKRLRDMGGLSRLDKKQQEVSVKIEEAILNDISKREPKFFDQFASYVQSGDPIKVQSALRLGGDQILKTLVTNNAGFVNLLRLRYDESLYEQLTDEQKQKLKKINQLNNIDFATLKDLFKDFVDLDRDVIIYKAFARAEYLSVKTSAQLALAKIKDKQLATIQDKQIDLARIMMTDLGVGSDVWVSTDYVVAAYVAVAVVAIAVVHVIDFTPMPVQFGDRYLFQEKLIAGLTKQFAIRGQLKG
jgi:hypothetical protein